MELRLEEISKIIRSQIKHYESTVEHDETGSVVLVGDGIARVSGLDKCEVNELVEFPNGEYGMALNLEEDTVAVVLLGSDVGIREGETGGFRVLIHDKDPQSHVPGRADGEKLVLAGAEQQHPTPVQIASISQGRPPRSR